MDKFGFLKVKVFFSSTYTTEKIRPATDWDKIFTKHLHDKELTLRIYKAFSNWNNRQTTQQK